MDRKIIDEAFPERLFYRHEIGAVNVFADTEFADLIHSRSPKDPLAAHLSCLPTLLVMHRTDPPQKGSFLVRVFPQDIKLATWEVNVYKTWYPNKKLLLYAPLVPQHIWFPDYLASRPAKTGHFKYA